MLKTLLKVCEIAENAIGSLEFSVFISNPYLTIIFFIPIHQGQLSYLHKNR